MTIAIQCSRRGGEKATDNIEKQVDVLMVVD